LLAERRQFSQTRPAQAACSGLPFPQPALYLLCLPPLYVRHATRPHAARKLYQPAHYRSPPCANAPSSLWNAEDAKAHLPVRLASRAHIQTVAVATDGAGPAATMLLALPVRESVYIYMIWRCSAISGTPNRGPSRIIDVPSRARYAHVNFPIHCSRAQPAANALANACPSPLSTSPLDPRCSMLPGCALLSPPASSIVPTASSVAGLLPKHEFPGHSLFCPSIALASIGRNPADLPMGAPASKSTGTSRSRWYPWQKASPSCKGHAVRALPSSRPVYG
jgi:hypothetical protein